VFIELAIGHLVGALGACPIFTLPNLPFIMTGLAKLVAITLGRLLMTANALYTWHGNVLMGIVAIMLN
jgi:hypothetical protein